MKKPIDRDTIREMVTKADQEGKKRVELYEELLEVYEDPEKLAKTIAYTPKKMFKESGKGINNFLLALLGLSALIKVGTGIMLASYIPLFGIASIVGAIIDIWLIGGISKPIGIYYRYVSIYAIISLFFSILRLRNFSILSVLDLIFVIMILVVANAAREKIFPHLEYKGMARDYQGKYKLGDNI